ncbi:unnamed protein product [Absidia cylindrospora]
MIGGTRSLAIYEPTKSDDAPMESSQQKTQKQVGGHRQRPSQQATKAVDLYTLSDKKMAQHLHQRQGQSISIGTVHNRYVLLGSTING